MEYSLFTIRQVRRLSEAEETKLEKKSLEVAKQSNLYKRLSFDT